MKVTYLPVGITLDFTARDEEGKPLRGDALWEAAEEHAMEAASVDMDIQQFRITDKHGESRLYSADTGREIGD